jgi:hypothetical protein
VGKGARLRAVPTSQIVAVGTAHATEGVARAVFVRRAPLPTLQLVNEQVMDLYERVPVGTKVIVQQQEQ